MHGIDDIQVFKSVVDENGLSGASRSLGVAKSTLARRLATLEQRLGSALFHRGPRSLTLTNFGQECYRQCARVLAEADKLMAMAERLRATPSGSLHVITPPYLNELVLESLAMEYALDRPHVRVHLEVSATVFDPRLAHADLAIYPAFEPLPDADLVARPIFTSPFCLLASPTLPGLAGIHEPADLQSLPCLGFGRKAADWAWRLKRGRETSLVRFEPRFTTYHLAALLRAAKTGLGVAALPVDLCAPALHDGQLVTVLPAWQPPSVNIYAVYPSGRTLTSAAREFLDRLILRLPEVGAAVAPMTPAAPTRRRAKVRGVSRNG